jgi:hypothetical protein
VRLFELFSQRDERGSAIVTGSLPFDELTSVLHQRGCPARCSTG